MRHASLISCGVLTVCCGLFSACEQQNKTDDSLDPAAAQAQAEQEQALLDAQQQAERVAAAYAHHEQQPPQEIIWRDLAPEPANQDPIEPVTYEQPAEQAAPDQVAQDTQNDPADPAVQTVSNSDPAGKPMVKRVTNPNQQQLSLTQLHNQYINAIRSGNDSNLSKAITAATLSAVGPHGELDWSTMHALSPKDQKRVERYFKAVSALREQALNGDSMIDEQTFAGSMNEVFGEQPITIRSIELCEKVLGYGVYEAFTDHTFVAGRDQKLIIYVELDHFKPMPTSDGEGYEVNLTQEVELYESSGFEVWNHEPVPINDVSKNKRKDFFVVQLVTLPGKLSLGQYRLKVRILDENAGTRDEVTLPIQIVDDKSFVRRNNQ